MKTARAYHTSRFCGHFSTKPKLAHGLFTEDGHAVFYFDLLRGAAAVAVVVHTVLYFAANAFQNLFVLHFYCLLKISSQNAAS